MATLTVWKFQDAGAADEALATLERLQKQELVKVVDGGISVEQENSEAFAEG